MAFVKKIGIPAATGTLKQIYDAAKARAGYIAEIIQVMSLDANVAATSMQLYAVIMKSPRAIDSARKEMLATVVSNVNDCYY